MKRILLASLCVLMSVSTTLAVVGPTEVTGKEYSNYFDEDFAGKPDALQVIAWDGMGGSSDTFDYTAAMRSYELIEMISGGQVDALANSGDAFFHDVTQDMVPMLASFHVHSSIHYTEPGAAHGAPPAVGVWAAPPIINAMPPPLSVDDVDGLEVWGSDTMDDADRFSLSYDPAGAPGGPRVSVWSYDSTLDTAEPFIFADEIAGAIGYPDLADHIDLDAMMTSGDDIMFSIRPIGPFDGGEIWVWTKGAGLASFLVHGGETWDTAHSVTGHFSGYGITVDENINALEAIPEPMTICLLGLGGLGLLRRKR